MHLLLIEMRKTLGLSQRQMYYYLNISPSLYTMAELGLRDLPSGPTVKAANLWHTLRLPAPPVSERLAAELAAQKKRHQENVERITENCRYRLLLEKRKLDKYQKAYTQAIKLLETIVHLEAAAPPEGLSESDRHVFPMLKSAACKQLAKNGRDRQWQLQLRIAMLQTEAEKALEDLDLSPA